MKKALFLVAFSALSSTCFAADYADNEANNRILDRLDRLERDNADIQRQFYRGSTGNSGSSSASPAVGGNEATARLEARISELEEQIRNLNGRVEQAENASAKVAEKLDKQNADYEMRFGDVEKKLGGAAASSVPHEITPPAGKKNPATTDDADNSASEGHTGNDTKPSHTLGTLKVAPGEEGQVAHDEPDVPTEEDNKAQQQYDYAFSQLRQSKYAEAEKSFKKFIETNGKNPLAGNAYYWLGEVYYVQKQYEKSAIQFLKGGKQFPQGSKAPDSMLKLAMSLNQLKKRKEACATLTKLDSSYPDASSTVRDKAEQLGLQLGCK